MTRLLASVVGPTELIGELSVTLRGHLPRVLGEVIGVNMHPEDLDKVIERLAPALARGVGLIEIERGPRRASPFEPYPWEFGLDAYERAFALLHECCGIPHAELRSRIFDHVSSECYVCRRKEI